jgi:uncharacterized membrane protein
MTYLIFSLRSLHFIGLGLILGGVFFSFLQAVSKSSNPIELRSAKLAGHLIAAPGLVLLIITGLVNSYINNWAHFKGSGYMHLKLLLVFLVLILIFTDLKSLGKARLFFAQRKFVTLFSLVNIIFIIFLMEFRPF